MKLFLGNEWFIINIRLKRVPGDQILDFAYQVWMCIHCNVLTQILVKYTACRGMWPIKFNKFLFCSINRNEFVVFWYCCASWSKTCACRKRELKQEPTCIAETPPLNSRSPQLSIPPPTPIPQLADIISQLH